MELNDNIIVIPVYKEYIDISEEASLIQCLKILGNHRICIITYKGLNTEAYSAIFKDIQIKFSCECFDREYFKDVRGYNKLMLSEIFYRRFSAYKYILIYQLDAYVFRDELDYWCKQGYDYIGAPWFEDYKTHEEGAKLWAVGNGGFSLRRTKYFIKVLSWRMAVKKNKPFAVKDFLHPMRIVLHVLFLLGYHNKIIDCLQQTEKTWNEDAFYTLYLQGTWLQPKLPSIETAYKFAFECSPSYLYELNNKQLPFGCHAFMKNEFNSFWRKYIEI
jgi:hypothetical protein